MKEQLYELIRKEDVVLFVGAGFSRYAGYPTGQDLAKIITATFNEDEKKAIAIPSNLTELASEFVKVKGGSRNPLISILKKEFTKPPLTTELHDMLMGIPHLKTIITTNYDKLFETSYGDNCHVIKNNPDISYIDNRKVEIFKIHGDIDNPTSIIITKEDYTRFFDSNQEHILWSIIKGKLATKTLAFLGYSFNDSNIESLITLINKELGDDRKQNFLIAPNLNSNDIYRLNKYGIQYLDLDGEQFVKELTDNIRNNIRSDFDKGFITTETFTKFMSTHNLSIELTGHNNKVQLTGIKPTNSDFDGEIKFTTTNDKDINEQLINALDGCFFEQIEIDSNHLDEFKYVLNNIKILDQSKDIKITIINTPEIESTADVIFHNGFEYNNLPFKLYTSSKQPTIISELPNATLKIILEFDGISELKTDINYTHKEYFTNTNDELLYYNLIKNINNGEPFSIFFDGNCILTNNTKGNIETNNNLTFLIAFFSKLKSIESYFKIRFNNIKEPSNKIDKTLDLILNSINDTPTEYKGNCEIVITPKNKEVFINTYIKNNNTIEGNLFAPLYENSKIELYEYEFYLGQKTIEICDPIITNFSEYYNAKSDTVMIRTQSNKYRIRHIANNDFKRHYRIISNN